MHEVALPLIVLNIYVALEELMGVEKDAHADTWGAGAVEQGRFRRTYT